MSRRNYNRIIQSCDQIDMHRCRKCRAANPVMPEERPPLICSSCGSAFGSAPIPRVNVRSFTPPTRIEYETRRKT